LPYARGALPAMTDPDYRASRANGRWAEPRTG
jgi:hypothetical protein